MKMDMLYDRLAEKWVPAPIDRILVDRPLSGLLAKSLVSSLDFNLQETADSYKLEIAVPGMKKKNLELEVADGVLSLQGQHQKKDVLSWIGKTTEVRSTHFYRTMTLPVDADTDGIKAKCRDGLLKISIPKVKDRTTERAYPVMPAEEKGKKDWWQKAVKPFESLKNKIRNIMRKVSFSAN